ACLTEPDVLIEGHKIAGSAQRRHRGALLQHGGILLAQSAFTPELAGILEVANQCLSAERLARAIAGEFVAETGVALVPASFTDAETARILKLALGKYSDMAWNAKR